MAIGPIDYTAFMPQINLGQSLLSGLQAGASLREVRDRRAAEEQAAALKEQYRTDLQSYLNSPTPKAAAALSAKYPQQREAFKQSWDILSKEQRDTEFSAGMRAYNALQQGQPDAAKQVLTEQIAALENSGQDAEDLRAILSGIDRNPQSVASTAGLILAQMDPERFQGAIAGMSAAEQAPYKTQQEQAAALKSGAEAMAAPERVALESQKTAAEIRSIDSQISERSKRLALDQDKLQSDIESKLYELGQKASTLDPASKKLVNDSVISSIASDQAALKMTDLASRLRKEGGGWGAFGTAAEWLANATGTQDAMSDLRKEYIRIRNAKVLEFLPPGPATDRDIEIIRQGFPSETADTDTIARFLDTMARAGQVSAVAENAKAEWINEVGSLGKNKRDIVVDGVNVPAGTTFTEFSRRYINDKAAQRSAEQRQSQIQSRSYMRYATGGQ